MQMTNEQIVTNLEILSALNETGKLGYAIARNIRKLREEATEYLAVRDKIAKKHGELIDNGRRFRITEEKQATFREELSEFSEIEHDVNVYQVSEEVFTSGSLNSQQMSLLLWMVEE